MGRISLCKYAEGSRDWQMQQTAEAKGLSWKIEKFQEMMQIHNYYSDMCMRRQALERAVGNKLERKGKGRQLYFEGHVKSLGVDKKKFRIT